MGSPDYVSGGVGKLQFGIKPNQPLRARELMGILMGIIDEDYDPIIRIQVTSPDGMTTTTAHYNKVQLDKDNNVYINCMAGV